MLSTIAMLRVALIQLIYLFTTAATSVDAKNLSNYLEEFLSKNICVSKNYDIFMPPSQHLKVLLDFTIKVSLF